MSAISDDIDRYELLCAHFNEPVQYSHGSPACYGLHSKELQQRLKQKHREAEELALDEELNKFVESV